MMLKTIRIRGIFREKPQNKWVRKGVVNDMNAHFYVLLSVSTYSVIVVNIGQFSICKLIVISNQSH